MNNIDEVNGERLRADFDAAFGKAPEFSEIMQRVAPARAKAANRRAVCGVSAIAACLLVFAAVSISFMHGFGGNITPGGHVTPGGDESGEPEYNYLDASAFGEVNYFIPSDPYYDNAYPYGCILSSYYEYTTQCGRLGKLDCVRADGGGIHVVDDPYDEQTFKDSFVFFCPASSGEPFSAGLSLYADDEFGYMYLKTADSTGETAYRTVYIAVTLESKYSDYKFVFGSPQQADKTKDSAEYVYDISYTVINSDIRYSGDNPFSIVLIDSREQFDAYYNDSGMLLGDAADDAVLPYDAEFFKDNTLVVISYKRVNDEPIKLQLLLGESAHEFTYYAAYPEDANIYIVGKRSWLLFPLSDEARGGVELKDISVKFVSCVNADCYASPLVLTGTTEDVTTEPPEGVYSYKVSYTAVGSGAAYIGEEPFSLVLIDSYKNYIEYYNTAGLYTWVPSNEDGALISYDAEFFRDNTLVVIQCKCVGVFDEITVNAVFGYNPDVMYYSVAYPDNTDYSLPGTLSWLIFPLSNETRGGCALKDITLNYCDSSHTQKTLSPLVLSDDTE